MFTLALALATSLSAAVPATQVAPPETVGCERPSLLWNYGTAKDNGDEAALRALRRQGCSELSGVAYERLSDQNGVVTIRVFRRSDWSSSELLYTFDEMLRAPGPQAEASADDLS